MTGLLTLRTAHAQMGGCMGGGPPGGGKGGDCNKGGEAAADPVGASLVRIYAGERLRVLPAELQLTPEQLPLYRMYAQAVEQILLDEGTWAQRPDNAKHNALQRLGAHIDRSNNRTAAWEAVLDAARPLYASLSKTQQEIANQRLVVSLESSAWALPPGSKRGATQEGKPPAPPPADGGVPLT